METPDYIKYGDFNEIGDEFAIKRFDTPKLWYNYFWTENILVRINQTGRGSSVYRDDNGNRTNLIKDRIIYVKDKQTGSILTHGWMNNGIGFDKYRTNHGLGYTKTNADYDDIEISAIFTCAMDAPLEIWRVTVKNKSNTSKPLSVCPYLEFDLDGFGVYGGIENTITSKIIDNNSTVLAINNSDQRKHTKNNGFAMVDFIPDGVQTSKKYFLGNLYNSLSNPQAIKNDNIGLFATANEFTIGAFQKDIILNAGESFVFHLIIGPFEKENEVAPYHHYLNSAEFDNQFSKQKEFRKIFSNVDMHIPDDYFQKFFNIWNKQQVALHSDWAGGYNMGFRCTMQSAQAICPYNPAKTKQRLKISMKHQYDDGSALRSYWPLDEHRYADSGVWLVFTLTDYIKETGDFSILDEVVPYYDKGKDTIYNHILNAVDWIYQNPGRHNLPRVLFGDWNDSLNIGIKGEGESVWLAFALYWAHNLIIELAAKIGDKSTVEKITAQNEKLKKAIDQHCWDGQWYIAGFTDENKVVGSKDCKYGKIFSYTQSWAIMSGIADKSKYQVLEDALQKYLMTDYGLLVHTPAYAEYDPGVGRISTMPVGWGENASAYCHVSGFKAVADCVRGDGDAAIDTLTRILGCNTNISIDVSGIEPYSFTNMFNGPQHPRAGVSLKSWFTGTGPWVLRCISHWIFGVRPDYDGLTINPVLPSKWKTVNMKRKFRDAVYNIEIANNSGKDKELQITVDGNLISDNFIEYKNYNKTHNVKVCWK